MANINIKNVLDLDLNDNSLFEDSEDFVVELSPMFFINIFIKAITFIQSDPSKVSDDFKRVSEKSQ